MAPHITRITRHLQVIHKRKHISAHITTEKNRVAFDAKMVGVQQVSGCLGFGVFFSILQCCAVLYCTLNTSHRVSRCEKTAPAKAIASQQNGAVALAGSIPSWAAHAYPICATCKAAYCTLLFC
jgi:hypothetical protein